MSSKFSNMTKTQNPPKVCAKQPPDDRIPLPPFIERIFQGYAQWYDAGGTDDVQLAGTVTMVPDPPNTTWQGVVSGSPYDLLVEMDYDAGTQLLSFTITLRLNGSPVGLFQKLNVPARSMEPFDSGLVNFQESGGQQRTHCRIML